MSNGPKGDQTVNKVCGFQVEIKKLKSSATLACNVADISTKMTKFNRVRCEKSCRDIV